MGCQRPGRRRGRLSRSRFLQARAEVVERTRRQVVPPAVLVQDKLLAAHGGLLPWACCAWVPAAQG